METVLQCTRCGSQFEQVPSCPRACPKCGEATFYLTVERNESKIVRPEDMPKACRPARGVLVHGAGPSDIDAIREKMRKAGKTAEEALQEAIDTQQKTLKRIRKEIFEI